MSQDYHWEARRRAMVEMKRYKNAQEQAEKLASEKKKSEAETYVSTVEYDQKVARDRHLKCYSAKLPYRYNNNNFKQQW